VLGWTLALLALAWIGFVGWSAGGAWRGSLGPAAGAMAGGRGGAPGAARPAWLIFGRTRRREAERFTRSVQVMRSEARSLEQLLGVLRQRLDDEQAALAGHAERLMRLGDEAGTGSAASPASSWPEARR
jgi:hypothetical protein